MTSSAYGKVTTPLTTATPDFFPRAVIVILGLPDAATLTLTVCEAVPPVPLQVSVNALAAVKLVRASLPEIGLLPLHEPEAAHNVALLEDHVRVAVPLNATLLKSVVNVTVGGAGATATVAAPVVLPPLPVHVRVNVVVAVRPLNAWLPEVALVPLQPSDAVQLVAFVATHDTEVFPPNATELGVTLITTVGATVITITFTVWLAVPPVPVQLKV